MQRLARVWIVTLQVGHTCRLPNPALQQPQTFSRHLVIHSHIPHTVGEPDIDSRIARKASSLSVLQQQKLQPRSRLAGMARTSRRKSCPLATTSNGPTKTIVAVVRVGHLKRLISAGLTGFCATRACGSTAALPRSAPWIAEPVLILRPGRTRRPESGQGILGQDRTYTSTAASIMARFSSCTGVSYTNLRTP